MDNHLRFQLQSHLLSETPSAQPADCVSARAGLFAKAEKEAKYRGLQEICDCNPEEIRELGSGTFGTVHHGKAVSTILLHLRRRWQPLLKRLVLRFLQSV